MVYIMFFLGSKIHVSPSLYTETKKKYFKTLKNLKKVKPKNLKTFPKKPSLFPAVIKTE